MWCLEVPLYSVATFCGWGAETGGVAVASWEGVQKLFRVRLRGHRQNNAENSFPSEGADWWQKKPQNMTSWQFPDRLKDDRRQKSSSPPRTSEGRHLSSGWDTECL